ncbi:MAG: hypothetical protein WCT39_06445 [Candidatus Margulisiibacteriota bacterium]
MKVFSFIILIFIGTAFSQDTVSKAELTTQVSSSDTDTAYNYKNLYENGFYEDAIRILEAALNKNEKNMSEEPLQILAFSYIIVGRRNDAFSIFKKILVYNPDFTLDPILTPPRFYELFHEARSEWFASPEGQTILLKKKAKEDSLKTEMMKNMLSSLRKIDYPGIVFSILPGGAGQFYHKEPIKGSVIFLIQAAALGACIWSYNKREDIKDPQFGWTPENLEANDRYVKYMRVELSIFSIAWIYGIVDAFTYKEPKEKHR